MSEQQETKAALQLAFQYWQSMPHPVPHTSIDQLRADYERQPATHWFDHDTLSFYGSHPTLMHMPAPGIIVEPQWNAPEGIERYAVTVFVWDTENPQPNRITPVLIGRFHHSKRAAQFARAAYAQMTAQSAALTR
jgi:hypothetical protein